MFASVADVRGADTLALVRPALAGRRAETVVVAPSDGLASYVAGLAERAKRVRSRVVRPEEDNMLKISGDGRKAALDLRLVGEVQVARPRSLPLLSASPRCSTTSGSLAKCL